MSKNLAFEDPSSEKLHDLTDINDYIDCFGFSDKKLPGFSDEIEENPGTAIETGITLLRHQMAADLFGPFNRIVNKRSLNFLSTKALFSDLSFRKNLK